MYYPIGWSKVLNLDTECEVLSIQANHERELFFILTTRSIHIWFPRPTVEIVCHRRSGESVDKIGLNKSAIWKTDSSVIVVATERDQLLFYQVRRRISSSSASSFLLTGPSENDRIYRLRGDSKNLKRRFNHESHQTLLADIPEGEPVPALTLFSYGKLDLTAIGVSCLMSAEEELIVAARNGEIYGVHWDGNIDKSFPWSLSKEVPKGSDHVIDLKFSSVLSGFTMVFESGRVGFMPLSAKVDRSENDIIDKPNRDSPTESSIRYLTCVNNAICVEINHKYRLVSIGLKNSDVLVCNIGDSNANLVVNHKLEIKNCKYPHDVTRLGPVRCMRYSPDNFALVTAWSGGHFAIWSVFGSLLFCTQQWQSESDSNTVIKSMRITNCAWGTEGYNLWLSNVIDGDRDSVEDCSSLVNGEVENKVKTGNSMNNINHDDAPRDQVMIMSIARGASATSPHLTCSTDAIILMSETRLYVGPSVPQQDKFDHWIVVDLPRAYLNANYPVRYATVDRECRNLVVAGTRNFALYSVELNKWAFFSKRSHEESFSVCGDIIWWKEYLIASCYNYDSEMFELRAYLTSEPLSNDRYVAQTTLMEIIRISIFENRLLVLYIDGTLGMFMLNLRRKPSFKPPKSRVVRSNSILSSNSSSNNDEASQSPRSSRSDSVTSLNSTKKSPFFRDFILQIAPIDNLVISNLQANAYCISSIALTRLHFKNNRPDDSILLNACGKLFLLERETPHSLSSSSPSSDLSTNDLKDLSLESQRSSQLEIKVNSAKRLSNSIHFASASLRSTIEPSAFENVTFKAVSVIATNVEQFWISPEISSASEMSYFKQSLWLSCGGSNNNLQVWLPLLNDHDDPPTDLYVPDRIMLPIRCDIYPLAIRSSAPDVIEPDDAIVLGAESDVLYKDCKLFANFPYMAVKRQCRVYLHRVLRELLLNQHLGYYARKIAESCQSLPYFAHCFELLLHEVLEEEATSPVPLPDPMLPQVVRFIKEFPVYQETVVHCARKSELSMWSHLFDDRAVGNPRKLFQECLELNKLDTAASCLIILQSLDRNIVSQRMVRELIKAAIENPKYNYLVKDLENFISRAELDCASGSPSPNM